MNLTDVTTLAKTLMAEHITEPGWTFGFDNAERRMGLCSYTNQSITVSRHFAAAATDAQVRDVILHEIAHVLAGHRAGHGPRWKVVAARLGATPKSCGDNPHAAAVRDTKIEDAIAAAHSLPVPTNGLDPATAHFPAGRRVVLGANTRRPGQVLIVVELRVKNYLLVDERTRKTSLAPRSLFRSHLDGEPTTWTTVKHPAITGTARTAAPAASTAASPSTGTPMFRRLLVEGEVGVILSGRLAGSVFTVASIGRTRYTGVADGRGITIPFSMVGPRDGADAAPVVTAPPVRLRPGQTGVVTARGALHGERVTIVKVATTRYLATVARTGAAYRIPFDMVKEAA